MDTFNILVKRLEEVYKEYETKVSVSNGVDFFIITNPFWDENIYISCEDGIIFFFSFHHAHFDYCDEIDENVDSLIEYINSFLEEKRVVVELFHDETNLLGGDRYQDELNIATGESLIKSFIGDNPSLYKTISKQIKGLSCHCSIRGWNNKVNKDIDFVL
jgi:hypothetical protein